MTVKNKTVIMQSIKKIEQYKNKQHSRMRIKKKQESIILMSDLINIYSRTTIIQI